MAPITLYDISIPVFIRGLRQLSHILKKGEAYAAENSIPVSKLLETRLADDMDPLPYQIQRVSDTAKLAAVRAAGIPNVPMDDNETTFDQLHYRIDATIKVLESVKPESMEGKETIEIEMRGHKFTGKSYMLTFALPNFFFHVTTAYAILRHIGVPVGKRDYLGGNPWGVERIGKKGMD